MNLLIKNIYRDFLSCHAKLHYDSHGKYMKWCGFIKPIDYNSCSYLYYMIYGIFKEEERFLL